MRRQLTGQRLARAIAAVGVLTGSALFGATPSTAQVSDAELRLSLTAQPATAEPGQAFTYYLNYSCSNVACIDATIVDTLPPTAVLAEPDPFTGDFIGSPVVDPTGRTVTFRLVSPLGAGDTADIGIRMQFPAGTPEGTVATNNAEIRAANAPTVVGDPPASVTAAASSDLLLSKVLGPGQIAQVDTEITYRVSLTVAAGGTQVIANPRLVDTLPLGTRFVSASGGGTYDAAAGTVTWALPQLVPDPARPVVEVREVTVVYPTPTFAVGQPVTNLVTCYGTPVGETETELATTSRTVNLKQAGLITTAGKRGTRSTLGPGQWDTFTLSGANQNDSPLSGFLIVDKLPAALSMVQDGQPNLSGTGTAPQLTWRPIGGAFQTLATTAVAGGWRATAPATADELRADYGTVPAGFATSFQLRAGIPASAIGRDGQAVTPLSVVKNCATVTSTGATARSACTEQIASPLIVEFTKVLASAPQVLPGELVSWDITFGVGAQSAGDLVDPVVTDCLPPGFDLVNPADPADPANGSTPAEFAPPLVARGTCGTDQVQVTWAWTGASSFTVARAVAGTIRVVTKVAVGTAPGSAVNVATLTGANLTTPLEQQDDVTVASTTLLRGEKFVLGDGDGAFVGGGATGRTTPGGSATYKAVITNTSDVAAKGIVVLDALAAPGDERILTAAARDSAWQPVLAGPVTTSVPATVSYSTSANPCPTIIGGTKTGCDLAPVWTTAPPTPFGAARSIMVDFGAFELLPGQRVEVTFPVATPTGATAGATAWNSFAYTGIRADNEQALAPAEPSKVGLQVAPPGGGQPGITVVKRVNGVHAPDAPGAFFPAGTPLVFTYEVTNTGDETLTNLSVVDDQLGPITCPTTTLAPGQSVVCTSPTIQLEPGSYVNRVDATALPAEPGASPVFGTDRTRYVIYLRSRPGISIVKLVNGEHVPEPPGLLIPAGELVTFTYEVTNTGQVDLVDLTVTDDRLGAIPCPGTTLRTGAAMTCQAPPQQAILGTYQNVAVVEGRSTASGAAFPPVGDRGNYYNELPTAGTATAPLLGLGSVLLVGGLLLMEVGRFRRRGADVSHR